VIKRNYVNAKNVNGKGISLKIYIFTVISGIHNTHQMFTFCIIDVWQDMLVKCIVTAAQLKYKHTPQTAPPFKDLPVESFLIFNI